MDFAGSRMRPLANSRFVCLLLIFLVTTHCIGAAIEYRKAEMRLATAKQEAKCLQEDPHINHRGRNFPLDKPCIRGRHEHAAPHLHCECCVTVLSNAVAVRRLHVTYEGHCLLRDACDSPCINYGKQRSASSRKWRTSYFFIGA
jgi:hypothetical protein